MQNARKIIILTSLIILSICGTILYLQHFPQETHQRSRKQLYSYLVGYDMCSKLKTYQPDHSLQDVIDGMKACYAGFGLPNNMSEEEKARFLNEMEDELFHEWQITNRKKAEYYLALLDKDTSATMCVPLQLYYQVVQTGRGSELKASDTKALFHYTIATLDGKEVCTTRNSEPQELDLARVIPGFSKGVLGMKLHEKRKLFVHPDLAYRTAGWKVPPQSLLVIDVELIQIGCQF